jgi:hypothetical protein
MLWVDLLLLDGLVSVACAYSELQRHTRPCGPEDRTLLIFILFACTASFSILYLNMLLHLYIVHAQYIQTSVQLFALSFLLLTTCFGLKRPSSGVLSTSKLSQCIKYMPCSLIYTRTNVMFLL